MSGVNPNETRSKVRYAFYLLFFAAVLCTAWGERLWAGEPAERTGPPALAEKNGEDAAATGHGLPTLRWEQLDEQGYAEGSDHSHHALITERAKVHGGWLVRSRGYVSQEKSFALPTTQLPTGGGSGGMGIGVGYGVGLTFVPDPHHEWQLPTP